MRIIAGAKKGLPLKSLKGSLTRPTSDKVKESIFNIIGPFFDGGTVVELFGGSGSLSLEALSRGADEAIIFEKDRKACDIIRSNTEKCSYENSMHILQTDAKNAPSILRKKEKTIDLLFIDPPYAEKKYYELAQKIVDAGLLTERAAIICEHEIKTELPDAFGLFKKDKSSLYGNTSITIYKKRGFQIV